MTLPQRSELSAAAGDDSYYRLLAGLAGTLLLESTAKLGLFKLFAEKGPLTPDEIITHLSLHPQRGQKWLLALQRIGLLEPAPSSGKQVRYRAGPLARYLFHADGRMGWFHQDFLRVVRAVADLDLAEVLRGQAVSQIPYPPHEPEDVELLESWMRTTAPETLATIEKAVSFQNVQRLLDVAGGDGTMAIHYAGRYPKLHTTVFNLPGSASLARRNISQAGLTDRIDVVEGDFRHDLLPQGYQIVQFSRVLADWPEDVCRLLLGKARESLVPRGRVIICEPLADENPDLTLAWEFKYLPHDDFGIELYKPLSTYRRLLDENGFRFLQVTRRDNTIHSVIVAQRA